MSVREMRGQQPRPSLLNLGQAEWDLGYRYALHDLLDPQPGFLKRSALEVLKFHASGSTNEFYLREITLARLENYQIFERLLPRLAWRFRLGGAENLLDFKTRDLRWGLSGGVGVGREFSSIYLFALFAVEAHAHQPRERRQLEVGPEIGALFEIGRRVQGSLAATWLDEPTQFGDHNQNLQWTQALSFSLGQSLSLIQTFQGHSSFKRQTGFGSQRIGLTLRSYY